MRTSRHLKYSRFEQIDQRKVVLIVTTAAHFDFAETELKHDIKCETPEACPRNVF